MTRIVCKVIPVPQMKTIDGIKTMTHIIFDRNFALHIEKTCLLKGRHIDLSFSGGQTIYLHYRMLLCSVKWRGIYLNFQVKSSAKICRARASTSEKVKAICFYGCIRNTPGWFMLLIYIYIKIYIIIVCEITVLSSNNSLNTCAGCSQYLYQYARMVWY